MAALAVRYFDNDSRIVGAANLNLLLQQGNTEEAIQTAGVGVSRIPRSSALIIKKASILAEEARYQEAMAFVKSRMRTNRDGHLVRFYNLLRPMRHG